MSGSNLFASYRCDLDEIWKASGIRTRELLSVAALQRRDETHQRHEHPRVHEAALLVVDTGLPIGIRGKVVSLLAISEMLGELIGIPAVVVEHSDDAHDVPTHQHRHTIKRLAERHVHAVVNLDRRVDPSVAELQEVVVALRRLRKPDDILQPMQDASIGPVARRNL